MTAMRWPPWRRIPPPPNIAVHLDEAEQAQKEAKRSLAETRARWPRITGVTRTLRQIRAENDFARTIRNALKP